MFKQQRSLVLVAGLVGLVIFAAVADEELAVLGNRALVDAENAELADEGVRETFRAIEPQAAELEQVAVHGSLDE